MRLPLALALLLLLAGPAAAQVPALPPNPLAGEYLVHRNADVQARLQAWAQEFPEFATVERVGTTTLGMDLWAITLQAPDATPAWRAYLDGGHHGNEYFGVEIVMATLGWLVDGYRSGDAEVLRFLQDHAVKALPVVNPEGNAADTRKNSRQVDLNRNYPHGWGGEGAGSDPSSLTYRGEAPLSEPETQANFVAGKEWDPHVWISMHTGIAEFYWPWSYTHEFPPDHDLFLRMEKPFEDSTQGRVDAMQSAELYLAAGTTEDAAYGDLGIPAFVLEVHEDQFVPAYPGGIAPEMAQQLDGVKWVLENTRRLGALVEVASFSVVGSVANVAVRNTGWGNATNLTLTLLRGETPLQTYTVDVPVEGEVTATFAVPPGTATSDLRVLGRYPRLLINTTPHLEFAAVPQQSEASSGPMARTPGFEALLGLAALAVAVAVRRR
jgi:MYXO-CTERM domain-containing protein